MGHTESYMGFKKSDWPLWAGTMFDAHMSYPFITGGILFFLESVSRRLRLHRVQLVNER